MALFKSDQLADGYRKYPIEDHGKLRFQYASISALVAAYAIADQIDMMVLPPGRVRVLPWLSRITTSAFGAARTFSFGNRAYSSRPAAQASQEAELGTTFLNALDVSAAVNAAAFGTTMKFDMYSLNGITLFGTLAGGTMPIGASMSIMVAYLYE